MASSSTTAAASYGVPTVGTSPLLRPSSFSSVSSFSSLSCAYEVFLSFRGTDIRKNFIDHLYEALDQRGIFTFKDENRLRRGESISDQLLKAIEQSTSAIIVFSKDYASSGWCLNELEKIMDCKEKLGLAVYPVFYDVPPSDVRGQRGTFGEGFAKAVERKGDKADVWRKALRDAANLSGYDVRNTADGHESQCIKQIVKWFWDNYGNIFASFDENLIGIKPRVRKLVSLLGTDSHDDVRMIGIWGMGGVGKTTLADVTFHEVKKQFDGASFIGDVREKSKRIDGLQLLQKKILSNILMDKNLEVDSVREGKELIKHRLRQKKVLIILDDVDDDEQLRALAGDRKWFGKGSRILITTRDAHLLKVQQVDEIHGMTLLTEDEAIQLFSRYAFKKCSPTEGYDELSLNAVRYAGGLPLALIVLGSFLCGRGMAEWTSALKRLEKIPEGKILEKLQISYDGLNQVEKEIFLDIACFFKGWQKDKVIRMLHNCGFDPDIGIDVLVEKSLISLSNENKYEEFQMHDLLQEMGRNIGRHSRIWHFEDTKNLLRNNTGTEETRAIAGAWSYLKEHDFLQEMGGNVGTHRRLQHSDDIKDVLRNNTGTEAIEAIVGTWRYDEHTSSYDSKVFISMKKLRLLHLYTYYERDTPVVRGPGYDLPNELRWLTWNGYRHESLAVSFQAPKLVGLKMLFSQIVQLWKGKKFLDKLKFLDLSWSKKLIRTPDFSGIPNLIELSLRECESLIEVHPSIGDLQRLVLLDLYLCNNLVDFPSNIHMKSLEILNFTACWKFKRLPEIRGNMDRLLKLPLQYTALKGLPSSIANLTKLFSIDLTGCKNLLDLPDTICTLKNLKKMKLGGCEKLRKLPENLGHIESLEKLDVSGSGVKVLPSSIGHLKNLKEMKLDGCKKLGKLPENLGHIESLEELNLSGSGVKVLPSSIGHLKNLRRVSLQRCCKLILQDSMIHIGSCLKELDLRDCKLSDHQAIPIDFGQLSFLEKLDLRDNPFASLPFIISQLPRLKILDLTWCEKLKALPELPSSIAILTASGCTSLESIESLSAGKHEWLWNVSLEGCELLTMHENCDPPNCRHEQEKSSTTGQQPKHCKKLPLLQSMLQGHAAVNHRLSIYYNERSFDRAIPKWFRQEMMKGDTFVLKLPANWKNKITGFATCAVTSVRAGRGITLRISFSKLVEVGWKIQPGFHAKLARSTADVWIAYISLKMLQRSTESVTSWADWMESATHLLLKFSNYYGEDVGVESCAAHVVSKEDVEDQEASIATSSSLSSSSSLQQHYDPNFVAKTMLPCHNNMIQIFSMDDD